MAFGHVSLYRQTLANRQSQYNATIASGKYTPFNYPWDSLPALYLLLAITLTPRLPLKLARAVRYVAFALIVLHSTYVVSHRRTLWFAGGYGIGLASAWGAIMAGALLLCNDVGRDFSRLEARPAQLKSAEVHQTGSAATSVSSEIAQPVDLTKRKIPGVYNSTNAKQLTCSGGEQPAIQPYRLVWQGFPYDSNGLHVIDWAVDLTTSFRGVNWNHRISTLEPIDAPMPDTAPRDQSKATAIPVQTLRSIRLKGLQDIIVGYLLLDLLKTTMITDPYFLGLEPLESPTPWRWLAKVNDAVPIATRLVRLSMSLAGVITALTFIFSLSPLFFPVILPSLIDIPKITRAPLLEPCMYPPYWYPLTTSVFHSGLAGLWGKCWHQMFRYGISEPSRVLIKRLNLDRRGNSARIVQLLIAFGLSGTIHAAGSCTSFSLEESHPLSGPLLFFLYQGVGIFVQSALAKLLYKQVPSTKNVPRPVKQSVNALVVMFYLYFTGPLLANDFARCGIWLFEPVPISVLRGLGFGPGGKDEGWWVWYQEGSRWMGWWKGDRWWERGIAIY